MFMNRDEKHNVAKGRDEKREKRNAGKIKPWHANFTFINRLN